LRSNPKGYGGNSLDWLTK